MAILNIELSQQQLTKIVKGGQVNLGEIGGYKEVTVRAEPYWNPAPPEVTATPWTPSQEDHDLT